MRDGEPAQRVGDHSAQRVELGGCGRVAVQVRRGQVARAERQRHRPRDALGASADDELRRAAADVDDRDRTVDGGRELPRRAGEREPCLVLLAQQLDRRSGRRRQRMARLDRVRGSPQGRRRDHAQRLRPQQARLRACAATTCASASSAVSESASPARHARPRRVNSRRSTSGADAGPARSATSRRVVFDPMSMQAQRTAERA